MNTDYYSMRDETAPKYPRKEDFYTYEIYNAETMEQVNTDSDVEINKAYVESVLGQRISSSKKVYSNDDVIVKVLFNEDAYKSSQAQYGNESQKRMEEFKQELFNLYGSDSNQELNEVVFSRAWQEGHSGGLYEVQIEFEELMEFADEVQKATQG
tara:strand:+ start:192 stop:656 length:465 start_codon:yes stop_codon:yes gene_type:complete